MSHEGQITDAAPTGSVGPGKVEGTPAAAAEIVEVKPVETKPVETKPVETKPAETKPAEVKETSPLGEKKETAPVAPIKYEFKLPEGVKLDEKQLATFGELGNKLKLQPEAAQELFDYHYTALKAATEAAGKAASDANTESYNKLIGEWKAGIAADPELSGDNEAKAHEILGQFLDEYGSPEARKALDITGAGWNPHVIKMVLKAAAALTEGGPTPGGNPPSRRETKTPGQVFYPPKSN